MNDLADVIAGARLYFFADVALVIFLAVFAAIFLRVVFTNRATVERQANLPLQDDAPSSDASTPRGA